MTGCKQIAASGCRPLATDPRPRQTGGQLFGGLIFPDIIVFKPRGHHMRHAMLCKLFNILRRNHLPLFDLVIRQADGMGRHAAFCLRQGQ